MKFPTTYFLVQTFIINPFKRTSSDTANLFYEEKLSTIFSVILVPPPQQI